MNSLQEHAEHSKALEYITIIGCSLSLLGIVITLILHMLLWRLVIIKLLFSLLDLRMLLELFALGHVSCVFTCACNIYLAFVF